MKSQDDCRADEKDLTELLKQIRLVHFTLLIISITVGYMVLVSYSNAPGLSREFPFFKEAVSRLSAGIAPLHRINRAWVLEQYEGSRFKGLITFPGIPQGSYRVISRSPLDIHKSLGVIIEQLEAPFTVYLEMLGKPSMPGDFEPKAQSVRKSFESTCSAEAIPRWQVGNEVPAKLTITCRDYLFVGMKLADELRFVDRITEFDATFEKKLVSVALSEEWWARFPTIRSDEAIRSLALEEVPEHLRNRLTSGLEGKKPRIAGVEIEGRHVGILGPIAIAAVLLYLATYIDQLGRETIGVKRTIGPVVWIGAMSSRLAFVLSVTTMVLLPAAVSFFAIYRLVWPSLFALVVTFPICLIGGSSLGTAWNSMQRLAKPKQEAVVLLGK